ncbi:hypothetical protein M9H77_08142 [Catharanthus roseus]|uniref:Uncharacterized protein n=1 Tax=Catharanthus roseus TaxID=4058 RepID=A0ACC0BX60_CATRO|nr:hypothetical protein M9H77_08142 [Catharanthus roseus]
MLGSVTLDVDPVDRGRSTVRGLGPKRGVRGITGGIRALGLTLGSLNLDELYELTSLTPCFRDLVVLLVPSAPLPPTSFAATVEAATKTEIADQMAKLRMVAMNASSHPHKRPRQGCWRPQYLKKPRNSNQTGNGNRQSPMVKNPRPSCTYCGREGHMAESPVRGHLSNDMLGSVTLDLDPVDRGRSWVRRGSPARVAQGSLAGIDYRMPELVPMTTFKDPDFVR